MNRCFMCYKCTGIIEQTVTTFTCYLSVLVEGICSVNMVKLMMYVVLTYDHRIIEGRESASFLVSVKEILENPAQLLF